MQLKWWPTLSLGRFGIILRGVVAPLLLALFGFLLGLQLFFPDDVLRERLQAEANRQLPPGATLKLQQAELSFPFGVRLDGVRVRPGEGLPELAFERIDLAPTFATLFGSPGVRLSAAGSLGQINGRFDRDGEVALQIEDGQLDLVLPQLPKLRLHGKLARVSLQGRLPLGPQSTLHATLRLSELALEGGESLGLAAATLPLGQLQLGVDGAGRSLTLRECSLSGGAVQIDCRGEVLAQNTPAASRIDLNLQIRPAAADGGLRNLLELIGPPAADNSWALHLRGPLLAPTLN